MRPMVIIESSVRELRGAVQVDGKVDEGTGSVPSIVLVTTSTDGVAGDANAEETSIDDAALDDVVIWVPVESSEMLGAMTVIDSRG